MNNFYGDTIKFVETAAKSLKLSKEQIEKFKNHERIVSVNIPLKIKGKLNFIPSWRVEHNSALGPYKGGIRFHPESNLEEVKALAILMSLKNSVLNLPYGGGKGAAKINPRILSKKELETLSRNWVKAFYPILGPNKDIPAPDVNTNPQIIDWMTDEYRKLSGNKNWKACFTGKSLKNGGSLGRNIATGFGGGFVLEEILKLLFKKNLKNLTIAVQGFGNVGSNFALFCYERGAKILAVSDSRGGIYAKGGINIKKLFKKPTNKKLADIANLFRAKKISHKELLKLRVDILAPSALENVITAKNAGQIKTKIIIELANGPIDFNADKILNKKGIIIIPDIVANGGGVIVSYFEWLQNLKHQHWNKNKVVNKLKRNIKLMGREMLKEAKKHKISLRIAAYRLALKRIMENPPQL